jgi:membrane dipeptidase
MTTATQLSLLALFLAPPQPIIIDTHADTTQRILDGLDFAKSQPELHEDLPKLRAGGLSAQFFSIWVDPAKTPAEKYYSESLRQLEGMHRMIEHNRGAIAWAKTADDVRANAARGVISALFGVEGGHSLAPGTPAEQLAHLHRLAELGARYMTLTWANSNQLGGSSGDEGDGRGLTELGRRVIDEMQRLGVIVDLSHVSDPMFWDAIRYAKRPVLASHSSSRELCNVPRNLSDAMLKAIAKNGGAVCVNFFAGFLDADFAARAHPLFAKWKGRPVLETQRRLRDELRRLPPVPLAKLVDHIQHVAQVAGIDHVCLGSDFDGVTALPVGLDDASKLPLLVAALRQRGYSEDDLAKILGGNVLRVLAQNPLPGEATPP